MGQWSQTPADAKMGTALESMSYSACTVEDISFLKTRIAGRHPDQPKLVAKNFQKCTYYHSFKYSKGQNQ
jgi:hypothetical protein